jgi:hypothetical protein
MSQCIDCDSLFVRAVDQCEGKISQKHTSCFMLRWRALPVGMREHELWHPLKLEETCFQALRYLDDSSQLQHDSLQDLTCFCTYFLR